MDGELQDDSSTPDRGFDPDRAIRWFIWVMLVADIALIGLIIYAAVRWGVSCFRVPTSCRT